MWLQTIKIGLCSHVLLKCIGITVFISLFFVAYFHVLNHPAYPATIIPLSFLDKLISFQPIALPIYLSLWIYVVMPPILIIKLDELCAFALSIALMSAVGLTIFYVWPTTIPVSEIDWALHPNIAFLKSVDAAGNACPSLHVATAIFSGAWTDFIFRRIKAPSWLRIVNLVWGTGIIYSTLATRQHVAFDVYGGILLASIGILFARALFWKKW
ncbi:MAG: phosphatase PAP2 family protein [Methylophilaceae bacterium]